jgi:two-component system sensor histidine kinase BarA
MTLSSYRVLIVDDNPTFVKALSMLIRVVLGGKLGVLDVATNGKEAVEKALENERYNVIFMDVNMPEMDGITATQIINRSLYRDTKVIAVSFLKDLNTVTAMLESGAENFLYKDKLTIESIEKVFNIGTKANGLIHSS